MSEPDPSLLRVGDTEREAAVQALGKHFTAGRLDVDEYGERTAKVTTARTQGELLAVFTDLPEPHPDLSGLVPRAAATTVPAVAGDAELDVPGMTKAQRVTAGVMAVSWVAMVPLFFILGTWMVFLAPLALSIFLGAVWGPNWNDPHERAKQARKRAKKQLKHREMREHHREIHDRHREMRDRRRSDDED
ncbi:DUF1707 domain-containing protein [Allokutzneria sp. A3M-2-11 16]|uniref:DUF1707 SHOCT-like domain-containing protein n=1 Tax=Allokutzneria sp. A3M-2-11 16 TaxID=2962043 RepID=UPI0020B8DA96|nr:DUF1707 domain-containing protein [Allokutzneria sp. A3M-2-11 16]MCP3800437.1 DUF1707 domain-containing protein [Allokutzneria sp. A3M-2-11 16]